MTIQDEFISTVSHELRTPLTSIRGFSQTLLNSWDKLDDNSKKKFITIIEEQSNRLINLVENILTVSKTNSGNIVLTKTDVNSVIEKVITIVKAQYKTHQFIFNKNTSLPPARLDEDKFLQVMTNLIDNAAKYSPNKTDINIKTEYLQNKIIIKVKDSGIGIKEEDFDKLFKKFSRLENHLTSCTQGNGLGLYITKQIVEKMDGRISLTSKENVGTTFILEFPVYNEEDVMQCSQKS